MDQDFHDLVHAHTLIQELEMAEAKLRARRLHFIKVEAGCIDRLVKKGVFLKREELNHEVSV